jgi:Tfp pilus assembly protein PilF
MSAEEDLDSARGYLAAGRLTSAAATFTKLLIGLATDIDNVVRAEALVGLGTVILARGDAARARLYASEALAHDSVCMAARQLMADLANRADAAQEAAAWRQEVHADP